MSGLVRMCAHDLNGGLSHEHFMHIYERPIRGPSDGVAGCHSLKEQDIVRITVVNEDIRSRI